MEEDKKGKLDKIQFGGRINLKGKFLKKKLQWNPMNISEIKIEYTHIEETKLNEKLRLDEIGMHIQPKHTNLKY